MLLSIPGMNEQSLMVFVTLISQLPQVQGSGSSQAVLEHGSNAIWQSGKLLVWKTRGKASIQGLKVQH